MQGSLVKIRGIYTTALTRLVLDLGYNITQPSYEICERFQIPEKEETEDISIVDRDDRQGIRVLGKRIAVLELISSFWEVFLDMVVRKESLSKESAEACEEGVVFEIEFPGATKTVLDKLRARVLPTIRNHHRMRIIASDYLDLIEREIERSPHRQQKLEPELMNRFVYQSLKKRGTLRFEHIQPEGETLNLREGEVVSFDEGNLVVKRRFGQGRYNGLDLPIEPGDYGITEVRENAWSLVHRYFTQGGELKGEYGNINTPIEVYPDRIRYVDLHVDVVRKPKAPPKIIDREKLKAITIARLISPRLQTKALEVSQNLLDQMNRDD